MISNPFYLLSILISAVLTFYTALFVIELIIILFRIKKPRIKANLKMLAFASLLLEIFGIENYFNPLSCFSCVQRLVLFLFYPELRAYLSHEEISFINYLAQDIGYPLIFSAVYIGWVVVTGLHFLRWGYQVYHTRSWIQDILKTSSRCTREIQNTKLKNAYEASDAILVVSEKTTVPMATYQRQIILPSQLADDLLQEEFESVIAHELEHIKAYDPATRVFMNGMRALFWWVPTNRYRKQIEITQEMACDNVIKKYGIDSRFLASAMIKTSKRNLEFKNKLVCALTDKKDGMIERIQVMLGIDTQPKSRFVWAGIIVVAQIIILILCLTL